MNPEEMEKLKKINNYGYSSFEEYGAFDLVDTKAQVLCLLAHNNLNGVKATDIVFAKTKDEKLVLYQKLGLIEFLNEALSMDDLTRKKTKVSILETYLPKIQVIEKEEEKKIDKMIENYQDSSTEDSSAKTLNIHDSRKLKREKALVEAMSSQAREQREAIQRRRDEMYEKMIEEAGEIESPANRLHH